MSTWETEVYKVDRSQLAEARITLHYAIQPLAATSLALVKAQPDFSHMSLQWEDGLGYVTHPITALKSYRVALEPTTLTLEVLGDRNHTISIFSLKDRLLSEAFDWIRTVIKGLGGAAELITPISYPLDDFPDSELARTGTFQLKSSTSNLSNYYEIGNQILQEIIPLEPFTSPIRIWPHHFDMASLISLSSEINGEAISIGVGLSPGDRSYDQPYWYVTPYPYPENTNNLPELEGDGIWHTSHWVGAVLTASQFGDPNTSSEQVKAFLNSAIAASKKILGIN